MLSEEMRSDVISTCYEHGTKKNKFVLFFFFLILKYFITARMFIPAVFYTHLIYFLQYK